MAEQEPPKQLAELGGGSLPFADKETLEGWENNPNKFVRMGLLIHSSTNRPDKPILHYSRTPEFRQRQLYDSALHYLEIERMFADMRSKYGVGVPDIDLFFEEGEGGAKEGKGVFMVVDRIEGKDLGNLTRLQEQEKFESFWVGLLQAMFDSYKERETYFGDPAPENVMYGHKSGIKNGENNFWLTDVGSGGFVYPGKIDVGSGSFIHEKNDLYDENFFSAFLLVVKDTQEYEKKFGNDIRLNRVRGKLKEIYEYLKTSKEEEFEKYLDKYPFIKPDESFFKKVS